MGVAQEREASFVKRERWKSILSELVNDQIRFTEGSHGS
jgi:hypothetical protein